MARPSAGPQIVAKLEGDPTAKQRLEAILATIARESTIDAASERLGLRPARFYVIRDQALQAALTRLEPRPCGRPSKPQPTPDQLRIAELERELTRLRYALEVAELRAQTSVLLPRREPKKSPPRRARRAQRGRARSAR